MEKGDLLLEGKKYISSKRASELTGYSRDYIGQLSRAGKIQATVIGRAWYVLEESLLSHKEVGTKNNGVNFKTTRVENINEIKESTAEISNIPKTNDISAERDTSFKYFSEKYPELPKLNKKNQNGFSVKNFRQSVRSRPVVSFLEAPHKILPASHLFIEKTVALSIAFVLVFGTFFLQTDYATRGESSLVAVSVQETFHVAKNIGVYTNAGVTTLALLTYSEVQNIFDSVKETTPVQFLAQTFSSLSSF